MDLSSDIKVQINYVDGSSIEISPEQWPEVRADGVDVVIVKTVTGSTRIAGMTLYWLYIDEEGVIHRAGAALGPGYIGGRSNPMPSEVLIYPDGTMDQRPLEWVPDMPHKVFKMGWWYPGTEGRPI